MITRLDLRHFKCFRELKLPLGSLTLLSGANASGKSSVLHALGLMQQTIREHEWSKRLMLNGVSVRLGVVADVVDQLYGRRECDIGLVYADREYRWRFRSEHSKEMSMGVVCVCVDGVAFDDPKFLRRLMPLKIADHPLAEHLESLTYLTAERMGPREVYQLDDPQVSPVVGPTGEDAVSVLHQGRDETVLSALRLDGVPPTRWWQVVARMGRFFPGCGLSIEAIPHANAVTLGLRTSASTEFHRPINTGFGLTQVLPVVVAAMSAKEDDLLLIENPEVHLHPAGQAAMGEFLVEVAAAGIQVLIETHSDHILNGVRRAVKNGVHPPHDVLLHFFRPRDESEEGERPQIESPAIDAAGNLDAWPEGFFDQFDKDTSFFAGW